MTAAELLSLLFNLKTTLAMDSIPSFDETEDFSTPDVPAEGHQNVSIKNMSYEVSGSGNDMLVAELIIDSGEDARMLLTEYLVMGHESGIGESRLKSMAKNTRTHEFKDGYRWEDDVDSWDDFAAQFVRDEALRFGVEIEHEYSIETERGWKNDVGKDKYQSHVEDGGKGRVSAEIAGFDVPNAPSEVPDLSPAADEEPKEENGFPEYDEDAQGDGAPANTSSDDGEEDDDGLPF